MSRIIPILSSDFCLGEGCLDLHCNWEKRGKPNFYHCVRKGWCEGKGEVITTSPPIPHQRHQLTFEERGRGKKGRVRLPIRKGGG